MGSALRGNILRKRILSLPNPASLKNECLGWGGDGDMSLYTSYPSIYSDSSKYTQQSLNLALELQKSMDADMGGTEIYQPFQHIFSKRLIQGNLRQVRGRIVNMHS